MPHTTVPTEKFKAIKLVIFDWSGVISDDRRPVYEANKIVVGKYGVEHEDFQNWLIHTNASAPLYFASRGITADPDVLMEEYRTALEGVKQRGVHPVIYSDADSTLKTLAASKKLFVVSMHPKDHLEREAKDYAIGSYISNMFSEVKDKAVAIDSILTTANLPPLSALYVGDTIFDIKAAKRSGVRSAGITTGYQTRDVLMTENPDFLINSLSELLNL